MRFRLIAYTSHKLIDGIDRLFRSRRIIDALEGYRACHGNVKLTDDAYGNTILRRFPLTDKSRLDLTVRFKKRRRAQLRGIVACEAPSAIHYDASIILDGGCNDVRATLGQKIMAPAGLRAACGTARTFTSVRAPDRRDSVFENRFAAPTKVSREASNYLPLVGAFALTV